MSIAVECGSCRKRYSVDDKVSGKKVKCKHCGNVFTATPVGSSTAKPSSSAGPAYVSSRSAGSSSAPAREEPIPFRDDPPDFDAIASLASGSSGGDDLADVGKPVSLAPPPMPSNRPLPAPLPGTPVYAAPAGYAPPAYAAPVAYATPAAAIYAANKAKNRNGGGGNSLRFLGVLGGIFAFGIVLAVIGLLAHGFAFPAFVITVIFAYGLLFVGGIGILIAAFRESALHGLLCLFVPFYSLIFLVTHWQECRGPFLIQLTGILMFLPTGLLATQVDWGKSSGSDGYASADSEDEKSSASGLRKSGRTSSSNSGNTNPSSPDFDEEAAKAEMLLGRVRFLTGSPIDHLSREEAMAKVAEVKSETVPQQAKFQSKPAWAEISRLVTDMEKRAASLESSTPDPSVFQDPPLGVTWKNDKQQEDTLGPEVSFRGYKIRIPKDLQVELDSSETGMGGLKFSTEKHFGSSIRIRSFPRTDPRQKRPWVASQSFQLNSPKKGQIFAADGVGHNPSVTYGRINGLAFTRIEANNGNRTVKGWIRYYAIDGNDWIEIAIDGQFNQSESAASVDLAAKTFRKAAPNEPHVDPFGPQFLVPRLAREAREVEPLLRKAGPAAEPYILALLKGGSVHGMEREAAVNLLPDVATTKGVPELKALADSKDDRIARAARAALKKVAPDQWDAVTDAITLLRGDDVFRKREALDALAAATPDAARRQQVATLLEDIVLEGRGGDVDKAGKALSVWAGDKTVLRLLPVISDEHKSFFNRRAVITALGGTKDKRAATAILRWIIKEPEAVVAACIQLGPIAEEQVLAMQLLREKDAKVRASAAQILGEVGTVKCYQELLRASKDTRDAAAAAVAQTALESVKERMKKPATKPS